MRMVQADTLLSTYKDESLMAVTFVVDGSYGTRYYNNKVWVADEIYEGHSEEYAENAAENYVLGVKKI